MLRVSRPTHGEFKYVLDLNEATRFGAVMEEFEVRDVIHNSLSSRHDADAMVF